MTDLPIPAELAVATEPYGAAELALLQERIAEAADELAVTVEAAAAEVAARMYTADHTDPAEADRAWRIGSDAEAEWAMRHVADAERQLADLQVQAADWAERIQQWFDQAAKPLVATRVFMGSHLQHYGLARRADTGKATLVLPSGAVATRSAKPKAEVVDAAAVLAWAEQVGTLDEVAPLPPRKPQVSLLRQYTEVAEVVDEARVLLATGEWVDWHRTPDAPTPPEVGDVWHDQQVANVDLVDAHLVVRDPEGNDVPGTEVAPGTVTATVQPA
jgi:phage host-nuclease inhibitor protein Gam